jgi:hypothetical protein
MRHAVFAQCTKAVCRWAQPLYFESYLTSENFSGQGSASGVPNTHLLQVITKFPNLIRATIFTVTVERRGKWITWITQCT